jgi:molybdenum cofactor biosynthesis enzyme MoaA
LIERNPKCVVSITTNGTVYTRKVRRVKEKLNCEVIVSLDSVTKATYKSIRKNASPERTLRNLQAFFCHKPAQAQGAHASHLSGDLQLPRNSGTGGVCERARHEDLL